MDDIQQRSILSELSEYKETDDVVINAIRFIRYSLYMTEKKGNYEKRVYLDISETLREQEKQYNKLKKKCLTYQKTSTPEKKVEKN